MVRDHLQPPAAAPPTDTCRPGVWNRQNDTDGPGERHEMRVNSFKLAALLLFAFVAVTWIKKTPGADDAASSDSQAVLYLQTLYRRLDVAERLGWELSRDLRNILKELRSNSTGDNSTEMTMQVIGGVGPQALPSNIYHYLPHLREHEGDLLPRVVLGKGRHGVSIVMGVPTVKRDKESYLINTINSLLFTLSAAEQQDLLIVIFVAETNADYVSSVAETIRRNFPKEVESGLLEVISPPEYYYPNFTNLRETFGDSKDRVKWRTKQNLDFSFLMFYAKDKADYYIQLEDDIIAKSDYYYRMKSFITQKASQEWLYLEFSHLGFIGKMFRSQDLSMVAEFFLMFHKDKPIDWLLDHILWVKVCSPEKDAKDCNAQKARLRQSHKPSLFQHVGLHSSLAGKMQPLKDKDFGKQTLYTAHSNPTAELSSSLKHYKEHSLHRAYTGQDFFWALTPTRNDYILFTFPQPIHISGYLFRSGNIENSADRFYNTTVEVLPSNTAAREKLTAGYRQEDRGFVVVGAFDNGVAEGKVEETLQPISALRLWVHADADSWVVLSEVCVAVIFLLCEKTEIFIFDHVNYNLTSAHTCLSKTHLVTVCPLLDNRLSYKDCMKCLLSCDSNRASNQSDYLSTFTAT